jgi:CheY-like chemotaxis protein
LLRLVDLQVEVADNGRIAVDMARRGTYDLILMDMQMPEMDGLDATRLIRTLPELDATPIVAMTASAFGADRDACVAAGMNDHIGKPVNPAMLYETMLRWLDESRKAPRPVPANALASATVPSAPALALDVLEGIDALDVVRAMSLFAGQRALYMQALGYFVDLYGGGLAAVDRYLARPPVARSIRWAAPRRRSAPSNSRIPRAASTRWCAANARSRTTTASCVRNCRRCARAWPTWSRACARRSANASLTVSIKSWHYLHFFKQEVRLDGRTGGV